MVIIYTEYTLFLKKSNEFPINKIYKVLLMVSVGSGEKNTQKDGLSSGDTKLWNFTTYLEGLEKAGFVITSKKLLNQYLLEKEKYFREHMKYLEAINIHNKLTQSFKIISFPDY